MSGWLIAMTGGIYTYIAVEQFWLGAPANACVYAGYAFSNIGLWALAR